MTRIIRKRTAERLESRDEGRQLQRFAARARSAFYGSPADTHPLGTLEAFLRFAFFAPEPAGIWRQAKQASKRLGA
jgi:hypothetical protein